MDYTTTQLVEQKIKRSLTDGESSFLTTLVIPAITDWINIYIGRKFVAPVADTTDKDEDADTEENDPEQVVVYRNGGSSAIQVGNVGTVTKVEEVQIGAADDDEGSEIVGTDWFQTDDYIFTYSGKPFLKGVRNIRITGDAGAVPASIRLAATIMAANAIADNGQGEVKSESIGDYSVSYARPDISELADGDALNLLQPFKPLRLA